MTIPSLHRSTILLMLGLAGCAGGATAEASPQTSASAGGSTEASAAPGTKPAGEPSQSQPFVWEVRSGDAASYLLGTTHVGVSLAEALPELHRDKLEGARVAIFEIDPEAIDPAQMRDAMQLPEGDRLDAVISERAWQALEQTLGQVIPAAALSRLRPWAVMTILIQAHVAAMQGGQLPANMDEEARQRAHAAGVQLDYLETPAEQVAIMSTAPREAFVEFLEEMALDPSEHLGELRTMLDAYRAGDAETIASIVFDPEDMAEHPAFYQRLFGERNEAWLPALEAEIRQGDAFVAVGLGHLLGDGGLVRRLRERGFEVKRLGSPTGKL